MLSLPSERLPVWSDGTTTAAVVFGWLLLIPVCSNPFET